jgi:hypothetical protein
MSASAAACGDAGARPSHAFLLLSDDADRPLEARRSVPRTCLLAVAAAALVAGAPLYWASSAEGGTAPVGTLASKDASSDDDTPDNCGPGDDPDGTTAPGQTTSTFGGKGGTSSAGTSAPGVTTAPGMTSEGGDQTTGQRDTTLGGNTSTRAGQDTSTGGHATNTTAGETDLTRGVQETATVACPPEAPPVTPPVTPPPDGAAPPNAVAPAPGVTPGTQPAMVVLPARSINPSARLIAPAGCPPQSFYARVRGRGIASVRFTLDGRRLKTVYRPAVGGDWRVRVNTRSLSTGRHRIVARVAFDMSRSASVGQSTGRTSKTMSLTFTKCARASTAPAFTG